jgi:hypothetical protein
MNVNITLVTTSTCPGFSDFFRPPTPEDVALGGRETEDSPVGEGRSPVLISDTLESSGRLRGDDAQEPPPYPRSAALQGRRQVRT